jgi:hypothetical protein
MRAKVSSLSAAALLCTGFLLFTVTGSGLAQTGELPFVAGTLEGGPILSENQQQFSSNPELLMGLTISANMCRNVYVETKLSGIALHRTGNADVKSFAEEIIAEDRAFRTHIDLSAATQVEERYGRWSVSLPESDESLLCASLEPSETRQAEKQMKRLSGLKFDRMYLVQIDAYIKNDGEVGGRATGMTDMPDLNAMGMLARSLAEERESRISRLTAEENFRIQ